MIEPAELNERERRALCQALGVDASGLRARATIGPARVFELAGDAGSSSVYVVSARGFGGRRAARFAEQLERCAQFNGLLVTESGAAGGARVGTPAAERAARVLRLGKLVVVVTRAPSGLPLSTWLEREPRLPFFEAHLVLRDLAAALAALHAAGLVDGALDAARVWWSAPHAAIEACGIGWVADPAPLATDDVLAFGCLAYRMLTGADPHGTAQPSVARRRAHTPPGLARLITRCLDPDPVARPAATELDRFFRLLSVPPPSARRRHIEAQAEFMRRRART